MSKWMMKTSRSLPIGAAAMSLFLLACGVAEGREDATVDAPSTDRTPATVVSPAEGEVRWLMPASGNELGSGAEIRTMIDYRSVPHASLGAFVVTATATGILVHAHVMQAEVIYVISGSGVALVGDEGREEVPLEPGSVLYVPERAWHGFRNADPDDRLKLLIITRPTHAGGLADFFRAAATRPGEASLDLAPEDLIGLLEQHGMEVPRPDADE